MIAVHIYDLNNNSKAFSQCELKNNLAKYLDKQKEEILISYNQNGKPSVDNYYFSISHSKNTLAQAFSKNGDLGIDTEKINENRNFMSLAKRYFHETEYMFLQSLSKQQAVQNFYKLWTLKEAVCKAEGGRLWYYLKNNFIKNNQIVSQYKQLYLTQINDIDGFSLSLASTFMPNQVKLIHE